MQRTRDSSTDPAQSTPETAESVVTVRFHFLWIVLTAVLPAFIPTPLLSALVVAAPESTPLYETFEIAIEAPNVPGNRFATFIPFTFTHDGRKFEVEGFYDGENQWRARFMPDRPGEWNYSWSFQREDGSGSFLCTERIDPDNHGHVHRDRTHPRYLIHDDGTAHYWYGASWIGGNRYGPPAKSGQINEKHVSEEEFLDYFDVLQSRGNNGLLLEIQMFPLENDRLSWDLTWIQQGDRLVREMASRHIGCHISIFGTWARDKDRWFRAHTKGSQQVFDVWKPGDESAKENYIRTIVARFAGYPNVYWELGNEMGHSPNSGSDFVALANEKYIPWIRKYDPYRLPIGLSEDDVWNADIDLEFSHQTNELPKPTGTRPRIMNELVRGGIDGLRMWKDETIRNPRTRLGYRRAFWQMFTHGGCGTISASFIRIGSEHPLNPAALDVLGDQGRLRQFLETLPAHLNEMDTDPSFVASGPGRSRARAKPGECYVVYYLLSKPGQNAPGGRTTVRLPRGTYEATWYAPGNGTFWDPIPVRSVGGITSIPSPAFREDIALRIVRRDAD